MTDRSLHDAMSNAADQRHARASAGPLVHAGILLLFGILIADALGALVGGDLAWQRALGDDVLRHHALPDTLGNATFSAPNARWLPHEWIFATLWALAERNGLETSFRIACGLTAVAAIIVDARRAHRADPRARAISLALVVAGILPSLALRAQLPAWPLFALVLFALESGPRRSWWVVPIAALWFNLHASAVIVPAIVLVHGFGRALDQRRLQPLATTFALALASTLTCLLTPFGTGYVVFAVWWSTNPATNFIVEWLPVSSATLGYFAVAVVMLAIIAVGEWRAPRLGWSARLLTLALFGMALLHVRNLAFFYLAVGPWVAAALSSFFPRPLHVTRAWSPSDRGLIAIGLVGSSLLACTGAGLSKDDGQQLAAAIAPLLESRRAVRVACEDFSWCSQFAAAPNVRVLMDGRVDAYPAEICDQYRGLLAGDAGNTLEHWHVDAVLTRHDSPLARELQARHWQRVIDGNTQLFKRTPSTRS